MQISSVVLVCDAKISQLGHKNLAVKFNTLKNLPMGPSNPEAAIERIELSPAIATQ
jgi:hypothetical protein